MKENNIFKVNIENFFFSEIEEFRVDNEQSKLVKLPDINRYLLEARTVKVRLLNADCYDKYTEELKQLKESILRGNDVKNECERMVDAAEEKRREEERIQKEKEEKEGKEEKEEKGRKIREEKEERERKLTEERNEVESNERQKKEKISRDELEQKIAESKLRIDDITFLINDIKDELNTIQIMT